jgi:RsiW-degrading membrane proteinase PrsW (M82 family)
MTRMAAVKKASGEVNALLWGCSGCFLLVAGFLGLLTVVLMGMSKPLEMIVGGFLALAPVPIYIALVLWIDRFEAEPPWLLAMAFIYGACVSVFFAGVGNEINGVVAQGIVTSVFAGASEQTQRFLVDFATGCLSAPFTEETSKGIGLVIVFFLLRKEFNGIVDGVIYATMIALGFAMTEDIEYYARSLQGGGFASMGLTFVLRGVLAPYAHPLFTSMTGIGLGWAAQSRHLLVRVAAPLGGYFLAMLLHATWNLSTLARYISGDLDMVMILVRAVALLFGCLGILAVCFYALRRESELIRRHLQPELEVGRLTRQEVDDLASITGRFRTSLAALRQGGLSRWLANERFNQTASELAFLREHMERGDLSRNTRAEEMVYMRRLAELRRTLRGG